MTKPSRVMSTQHPDNVKQPFFTDNVIISGDDEIKEAFYAFSHLKCKEQLWDCEGKEVDNHVVKKLLTRYEPFFLKHKFGQDVFLTLRAPNPTVEKSEAKILLETLESIPRSYDVANLFYKEDIAPIFEVAIPMVTKAKCLIRISEYYKQHVVGKQNSKLLMGDIKISEWIGKFKPERLRIIPLFEDKESMLNADKIVEEFITYQKIDDFQRVWLARSDPALNYGSLAAVLINKIATQRLFLLRQRSSIEIYPILGCGSAPFRGNLTPDTVDNVLKGYPSIQTYTIQSAFKFDYPEPDVVKAIEKLNETSVKEPIFVDEEKTIGIINKLSEEYQNQIKLLIPFINQMSSYIPDRRKRKLHIGLFGYSRSSAGITLPRAIKFCASLYSWGLPPELLSLNILTSEELDYIRKVYPSFDQDLKLSLQYLNKDNLKYFPLEIIEPINKVSSLIPYEENYKHQKITSIIIQNLKNKEQDVLIENIERAGSIRGFLG